MDNMLNSIILLNKEKINEIKICDVYSLLLCRTLTLFPHIYSFKHIEEKSFRKHCGKG